MNVNLDKLRTIVFTKGESVISPYLVTTREYGRWLEQVFDEYTCSYELYLRSFKQNEPVMEFHPGTKIGQYFDKNIFEDGKFCSWYIYQDSTMMDKLRKLRLAEYRDAIPISVNDIRGRRMLRLYSIYQIELYVKTKIQREFSIDNKFLTPKKIALREYDMSKMIIPQQKKSRKKSLF